MAEFKYTQLNNTHWYLVTDAADESNEYAIFSLIDARHAKPAAGKHMELKFRADVSTEILGNDNVELLLDIYAFVFYTVVDISHNLDGVNVCKIHSHDKFTRMVYDSFAEKLGAEYIVKKYGKWIEILKK